MTIGGGKNRGNDRGIDWPKFADAINGALCLMLWLKSWSALVPFFSFVRVFCRFAECSIRRFLVSLFEEKFRVYRNTIEFFCMIFAIRVNISWIDLQKLKFEISRDVEKESCAFFFQNKNFRNSYFLLSLNTSFLQYCNLIAKCDLKNIIFSEFFSSN